MELFFSKAHIRFDKTRGFGWVIATAYRLTENWVERGGVGTNHM